MKRSTRSVTSSSPTRSLLPAAANASTAASSDATSALDLAPVPNSLDAERSTIRRAVSSRSSTYSFTKGRPRRAVTFQSIDRTSSPGWYSRTSENSRPRPLKTEWYSPLKRASTSPRVRSSIRRTCAEISLEKTREGPPAARGPCSGLRTGSISFVPLGRRYGGEHAAEDFDRVHAACVRFVRGAQAVLQDRRRHRLHVVRKDVVPSVEVGPRARCTGEEDRGARRRAELDQVLDVLEA